MRAFSLVVVFSSIISISNAEAANSCNAVFDQKISDARAAYRAMFEIPFKAELENHAKEVMNSKDAKSFNDNAYNLILVANQMMDAIVQGIISVQYGKLSLFDKNRQITVTKKTVAKLKETFELSDEVMGRMIDVRVNEYIRDHNELREAIQQRQPAGFKLHNEMVHVELKLEDNGGYRIGFLKDRHKDMDLEDVDPITPGFDLGHSRAEADHPGHAVGFGRSHLPIPEVEAGPQQAIGFVPRVEKVSVDSVGFDLETGHFVIFKGE